MSQDPSGFLKRRHSMFFSYTYILRIKFINEAQEEIH